MTFEESMHYIASLTKFGMKLGLERISALLEHLGHPERCMKFVHIAGTNGKGSVSIMVESVLRAAGYRTGIFTSPHLDHYSERIRVGGVEIGEEELSSIMETIIPEVEAMSKDESVGTPTEFEVCTAMCFEHFRRCGVQVAVVEVGLGGRFDSTNVICPEVSVITPVGMDHMDRLGDTIEKITWEKAGILKQGIPAVIAPQISGASDVIRKVSEELECPMFWVGKDIKYEVITDLTDMYGTTVDLSFNPTPFSSKTEENETSSLRVLLKMLGPHQGANAACAFGALKVLRGRGFEIPDQAIVKGMEMCVNPGRLEVVSHDPLVVIDGAHNLEGAQALAGSLEKLFSDRHTVMVCGFSVDKPYVAMLKELAPYVEEFVMTVSSQSRLGGAEVDMLVEVAEDLGVRSIGIAGAREAVRYALKACEIYEKPMVMVCGSLYLIGEVRGIWRADVKTEA